MKAIITILGIFIIYLLSSCHSIIKPKVDMIQMNNQSAIEKVEIAKQENEVIIENTRAIETIIDNEPSIPLEVKRDIKEKIDHIIIATTVIETRLEDTIGDIEKNEILVKSIDKEVKFNNFKYVLIIISIIVAIVGIIVLKILC